MDLLDMSITSAKGNRYVLVMVDCFSRWTEACPLSDKTASVADAFFSNIVCRYGFSLAEHDMSSYDRAGTEFGYRSISKPGQLHETVSRRKWIDTDEYVFTRRDGLGLVYLA